MFESVLLRHLAVLDGGSAHFGGAPRVRVVTSGFEPEDLNREQAADALVDVASAISELEALRVRLLARAAGSVPEVRQIVLDESRLGVDRDGHVVAKAATDSVQVRDEIVDELAARLRISPVAMTRQVKRARLIAGPLRRTCDLLSVGLLTAAHANAIAEQAARMLPEAATIVAGLPPSDDPAALEDALMADAAFLVRCRSLQDRVLPHAPNETAGRTRSRCSRVIASIDAAAERERRQRAKARVDVFARPLDDGLAELIAVLPAHAAATVLASVDALARAHPDRLLPAGQEAPHAPHAAMGQLRAAAFLDLLGLCPEKSGAEPDRADAGGTNLRVRTEIQVLVDAATLAGITSDLPAWVRAGSGDPVGIDRDELLSIIADPATPTVFRRLVCDPVTGSLVDRGARTYAPSAELVAWLTARDQTCRFPGCSRRAERCDVDHATNFRDDGPTVLANTGMLCRRHHNGKTHGGWRIIDGTDDGCCTFVSPHGHRFAHQPMRLLAEPRGHEPDAPSGAGQPPARGAVAPVVDWDADPPF